METEVPRSKTVVGLKQTRRAIADGTIKSCEIALDADPLVTGPIESSLKAAGVPYSKTRTMRELGEAAGISVGAAMISEIKA